ncbi:hypothetical protein LLG95_12630 [bacterium]|nr:hypothetical protein [bacterium]
MARKLFALGVLLMMTVAPALAQTGTVHVLFSDLNATKHANPESERVFDQLQTAGFEVKRTSDADLTAMNGISPDDIVVMSGVYVMNDDTINALIEFTRAGGGVLWIDAPTFAIIDSAAMRNLLGVSMFTTFWVADFADIGSGRAVLYKHFINGDHETFTAVECHGNSAWAASTAYELGRFPPLKQKEWHIVNRSPVRGPGTLDRIPALLLNRIGKGQVVLFNWQAARYGGTISLDMIRRAAAYLLADGDEPMANAILAGHNGTPNTMPSELLPTITATGEPKDEPFGRPRDHKLPMGIFMDPDNFGVTTGTTPTSNAPLREWPQYQKMLSNLKMLGVNNIFLYPYTPDGHAIWPSKIFLNDTYKRELFKEFCTEMHKEGITIQTYTDDPDRYFWPNPNDPATSRTRCLFEFAPKYAKYNEELIAQGLDGMCVPPDEYHYPVYNGKPTDDNECTRRFKKEYGFDMPAKLDDNAQSRAWINYEYQAGAEVYTKWNELAKKQNPKLLRTNIIFVGELCWNWKAPVNWGLIGHATDWTSFMTDPYVELHTDLLDHWYVPETTKRLMASTTNRQAMVTLQSNRLREFDEQLRPLHVYGEAVSSIAHGGRGVHWFHYFKLFDGNGDPYINRPDRMKLGNSLLRTLERWGVLEGQVPQQIALLHGQMSQDYAWLIRNRYVGNGYASQEAAIDMLLANGYPFEVYCMDQEADWAKLPKAKVIVVPFAYAISDKAVAQLESHARAGKKIILMQRLGEADMKGEQRKSPALEAMIDKYPDSVMRIGGDVAMGSVTPDYVAQYLGAIDAALGGDKVVNLDRCGQEIEATCLNLKGGGKILFAINWEKKPAAFELGINLPAGNYRLTERNLKGTQPATIKGKTEIDARDLKRFKVELETEDLKFWLVEPAK